MVKKDQAKRKILKAYRLKNDTGDNGVFMCWASTPGQAKYQMDTDIPYEERRVVRMPWADKYNSVEEIPPQDWYDNGYAIYCRGCGCICYGDYEKAIDGYCMDCYEKIKEGKL